MPSPDRVKVLQGLPVSPSPTECSARPVPTTSFSRLRSTSGRSCGEDHTLTGIGEPPPAGGAVRPAAGPGRVCCLSARRAAPTRRSGVCGSVSRRRRVGGACAAGWRWCYPGRCGGGGPWAPSRDGAHPYDQGGCTAAACGGGPGGPGGLGGFSVRRWAPGACGQSRGTSGLLPPPPPSPAPPHFPWGGGFRRCFRLGGL